MAKMIRVGIDNELTYNVVQPSDFAPALRSIQKSLPVTGLCSMTRCDQG